MNDTATNTNTNTTRGSSPRHLRRKLLVAAGAVTLLTMSACTGAQRRALGEEDVRESLNSQVQRVVNNRSLSIGNSLDCTSSIDSTSIMSASCVGTATSGEAITAAFTGTADVDTERCTAVLVVDIDGVRVLHQPYVQCFDSV